MADQITTADKSRCKSLFGKLSSSDMQALEKAIKIQLGFKL
jgi:mRNA-degrading endonuclease toxin of MazEF toxin-antitoxin module